MNRRNFHRSAPGRSGSLLARLKMLAAPCHSAQPRPRLRGRNLGQASDAFNTSERLGCWEPTYPGRGCTVAGAASIFKPGQKAADPPRCRS